MLGQKHHTSNRPDQPRARGYMHGCDNWNRLNFNGWQIRSELMKAGHHIWKLKSISYLYLAVIFHLQMSQNLLV